MGDLDPLVAPRRSTSLWIPTSTVAENSADDRVSTLLGAGNPEVATREAFKSGNGDRPWFGRSPVTSIQFVKRNRQIHVIVDGFLHEVVAVPVVPKDPRFHVIELSRHSGLHRDPESGDVVLSPLAITMMVEDGQRPPMESRVSILNTTMSLGKLLTSSVDFAGSEILRSFRVEEPVAPVVYAPYPSVHAQPPTVSFLDLTDVYKRELRQIDSSILTVMPIVSNLLSAAFMQSTGTDLSAMVMAFWTSSTVAAAGILSTYFMLTGYNALGIGVLTSLAASTSDSTATMASIVWKGVFAGASAFANAPPEPVRKSIRLTIPEFVRVLNVLGATSQLTKDQGEAFKNSRSFHHELVVWRWFSEDEEDSTLDNQKDKGLFTSNPIDLSKFNVPEEVEVAASHKVRVSVWDNDDDDGSGTPHMFDFITNRKDAADLGAVASKVDEDLHDLRLACVRFARSIDVAITNAKDMTLWYDYFFIEQTINFVLRLRPKTKKSDLKKSTNLTRNSVLKLVKSNIYNKLLRHFVTDTSAGMLLQLRLLKTSKNLDIVEDEATLVRGLKSTPFWRRVLPQRLAPTYLFSSDGGIDMDVDLIGTVAEDTETVSVRLISGLKDAVAQHTRVMHTSRRALVSLRRIWEVNNRVLLTQIYKETTTLKDMKRYIGNVDIGGLMSLGSTPDDLKLRELTVRLTETDRMRLDLICRPKNMSPMATIGFRESEHGVVAAMSLATFWADCLVASGTGDEFYEQVDLMGGSLGRAATRVAEAAEFILKTAYVTTPSIGYFSADDPAMRATRVGRDVRVVLWHVSQKPTTLISSRTVTVTLRPQDTVSEMRGVAEAMRLVASNVAKQLKKQTLNDGYDVSGTITALPFEPLQSLFMDPRHAIHAFRRVKTCMEQTDVDSTVSSLVTSATAASYASAQLLTPGADDKRIGTDELVPEYPRSDQFVTTPHAIRIRMAELRLDVPSSVNVHDNRNNSVDDLIDTFNKSSLDDRKDKTFFVPLGFGAVPRPSLPTIPIPAIMFSSVPVFTSDILARLTELQKALQENMNIGSAIEAHEKAQVVRPVFETIGMIRELGEPVANSPLSPPCILKTHGNNPTVVNFFGSTHVPSIGNGGNIYFAKARDSRSAAELFRSDNEHVTRVRAAVESLIWNTDRIAQALCVVASDDSNEFILDMDTVSHVPPFPPQPSHDTSDHTRMLALMGIAHLRIFKIYLEHMMQYAAFEFEEAKNDELFALGITSTPADVDDVKLDLAAESIVDQGPGDKALAPPVVATGALFDNNRNLDGDGVVSAILDNDTVFTDDDGLDWAKDIDAHVEVVMKRILDHRWPDVPVRGEKSRLFRVATAEDKRKWRDVFMESTKFGIEAITELERVRMNILNFIKNEQDNSIAITQSKFESEQEYNDTHARLCNASIRSMVVATVIGGALSNASLFDLSPKLVAMSFKPCAGNTTELYDVIDQLKLAFGGSVKALRLAEAVLISAACARLL